MQPPIKAHLWDKNKKININIKKGEIYNGDVRERVYFSAVPLAIVTIDLTSASSIDDKPILLRFSPVKDLTLLPLFVNKSLE